MGQTSSQLTPIQDRAQFDAAQSDTSSSSSGLATGLNRNYHLESVIRTHHDPSTIVSKVSAKRKARRVQNLVRSSSPRVIVHTRTVSAPRSVSEVSGGDSLEMSHSADILSCPRVTATAQSAVSSTKSSTMSAMDEISRKRKRSEVDGDGDRAHKSRNSTKGSSKKRKKTADSGATPDQLHTSIRQGSYEDTSQGRTGKRKSKKNTKDSLLPPTLQEAESENKISTDVPARSLQQEFLSNDHSTSEFLGKKVPTLTPSAQPSSLAEDTKFKKRKRKKEGIHREDDDQGSESVPDRTRLSTTIRHNDENNAPDTLPNVLKSADTLDAGTRPEEDAVTEESIKRDKNGNRIGSFSDKEKAIADRIFARACTMDKCTEFELRRRISEDWKNLDIFKKDIFEAFSDRTVKSVYRFCRRRFHPFERGPWSTEEDLELKTAYASYPDQWVKIAELVGRSSEAVRDRYRNYLMYDENLETGLWTEEQEEALLKAVAEAMSIIKKAHPYEHDVETLESWIDWNLVSSKLNGARSRKRCAEKYQKLKRRHPSALPGAKAVQDNEPPSPFFRSCAPPADFRASLLRFDLGDIWDLLTEIHSAIEDHGRSFYDETTFWSLVSSSHPLSRFSSRTRRRVFHVMLERYSDDVSVQSLITYAAKARRMAELVVQDANGEPLHRRYRLNRLGWTPEQIRAWRTRRKRKVKLTKDLEQRDSHTPDLLRV